MSTMRRWGMLLAGLLLAVQAFADVEVAVDPDPPRPNESFNLVFKGTGAELAEPDFTPLEEMLEILGRNQQTAAQWINGRHSQSTTWILNVIPKRTGRLHLPEIAFGKQRSAARDLEFAQTAPRAAIPDDDLILETDIEPRTPYVQQQAIYTVRLWHRIDINNASLSEPSLGADALVKRLGKDRMYRDARNGMDYEVFERRYAIYPQASGRLTLAPALLTAQVFRRRNSFFEPFGQSFTTRRLQADALTVEVRPIPKSFRGKTWLPAKRLSLREEWTPDPREAHVGEPVTHTLSLWVDGLTAGQLPTLGTAAPAGVNAYPDQPQSSEQEMPAGFTAIHQEKIALVPGTAGTFIVPGIELPWWNTETDRMEVARLPAVELHGTAPAPAPDAPAPQVPGVAPVSAPTTSTGSVQASSPGPWPWLTLLAVLGWAITAVLLLRLRHGRDPQAVKAAVQPPSTAGAALHALHAACAAHDHEAAKRALLDWSAQVFPPPAASTLGALASCLDGERAVAIEELQAALYGRGTSPWNGGRLWRAFAESNVSNKVRVEPERNELPPLFPLSG